jgi:hypothetical protein
MGFVFSLYYYYKGQSVQIEYLYSSCVPVKIVISRSTSRSARQINFRACLIATLGLGGMAQIVCVQIVACLQSVLQKLTYNLGI